MIFYLKIAKKTRALVFYEIRSEYHTWDIIDLFLLGKSIISQNSWMICGDLSM